MVGVALRNRKHDEKEDGEGDAGNGGFLLSEQIDDRDAKKHQRDQSQANRNLDAKDLEVKRDTVLAVARVRVAQDEDGEPLHRETPDHAEGIQVGKKSDVAAADDDGDDLQGGNNVNDAIGSPEAPVRLAEPAGKNTVFRYAVEHAVGAHDRGVHGASEDQRTHHHDEAMEDQP